MWAKRSRHGAVSCCLTELHETETQHKDPMRNAKKYTVYPSSHSEHTEEEIEMSLFQVGYPGQSFVQLALRFTFYWAVALQIATVARNYQFRVLKIFLLHKVDVISIFCKKKLLRIAVTTTYSQLATQYLIPLR